MYRRKPNAKQLSKELHDYQIRLLKGGLPDFHGVGDYIAQEAVNYDGKDGGLIRFMGSMGGKACLDAYHYWQFRDQVNDYQLANNISSVSFQEVVWDNKVIRYPVYNEQLTPMPQDKPILMRYKEKLTNWYINFATEYVNQYGYQLFPEDDDGYLNIDEPLEPCILGEISKDFEWCDITGYYPHIIPVYSSYEHNQIVYWLREFGFFLYRGDLSDYEVNVYMLRKTWKEKPEHSSVK